MLGRSRLQRGSIGRRSAHIQLDRKTLRLATPRLLVSRGGLLFFSQNFLNESTEFYVDGKSIPEVGWDVGPSWAGLLPISNKTDETREVCFIIVCGYGLQAKQYHLSYSFGSSRPAQKAVSMT